MTGEFSKLSHREFDQSKVGEDYKSARQSIYAFAKEKGWGKNENGHVLLWHLFQLYAMDDMNVEAKKLLQHIIKSGNWDDYYSRGTLAWMNGDEESLKKEIKAAEDDVDYASGNGGNVEILRRMLGGIGKKYREVY
jgi:hypothetical protein